MLAMPGHVAATIGELLAEVRYKPIPKTKRMWKGTAVYTHCQCCGKKMPGGRPSMPNGCLLTRLCFSCFMWGGEGENYELCAHSSKRRG